MKLPFVRRARYESLLDDAQSCALALRAIDDRIHRIRTQDEFVDQAEQSLQEIENILSIAFGRTHE